MPRRPRPALPPLRLLAGVLAAGLAGLASADAATDLSAGAATHLSAETATNLSAETATNRDESALLQTPPGKVLLADLGHSPSFVWGREAVRQDRTAGTDGVLAVSDMTTLHVASAAELSAALDRATGGETIVLADGDYGRLALRDRAFAETVTLTAATPLGARFEELDLDGVANLTIEGAFFDHTFAGEKIFAARFEIESSTGITIRDSLFDGDDRVQPGSSADGYGTGRGLAIRDSQHVTVEGSEIRGFWKGVGIGNSEHVTLRGNELHDMRTDGLNSTRSAHVTIEDNHFHSMRVSEASGDHPDFIQIYSTDEGRIPHDFIIRGNRIEIGTGDTAHAIFFHHGPSAIEAFGEDVWFRDIEISDNVIVNRQPHGIFLNRTDGAVITNNTLLAPVEREGHAPRINIARDSTNVVLERNVAELINGLDMDGEPGWQVADNVIVQHDFPDLPNHYTAHFINPMTDATGALENLMVLPDSPIAAAGAGAPMLVYDDSPAALVALARALQPEQDNLVTFDAHFSAGPGGPVAGRGAEFLWEFGDGSTARGAVVTHHYATPGQYRATLTVTMPDGRSDTSEIALAILGADVLRLDAAAGGFVTEAFGADGPAQIGDATIAGGAAIFDRHTKLVWDDLGATRFSGATDMTLTARLQTEAGGHLANIHKSFEIRIDNKGELVATIAGTRLTTTGANLTDGAWHDIAVQYDSAAGVFALQVDGATLAQTTVTEPLPATTENFKIGQPWSRGDGFAGRIERFEIDVDTGRFLTEAGEWDETALPQAPGDAALAEGAGRDLGAVVSYGPDQDDGGAAVSSDGQSLTLEGNAWKVLPGSFTVTEHTRLAFTFDSAEDAEMQAIGLTRDGAYLAEATFQIAAEDRWSLDRIGGGDYAHGSGPERFEIDLGALLAAKGLLGTYDGIVFINDDDSPDDGQLSRATFSALQFGTPAPGDLDRLDLAAVAGFTAQDKGSAAVLAGGTALRLTGNAWKAVDGSFEITEDTVLRFTFDSDEDAEMQAIGLARGGVYDADSVFQIAAEDHWDLARVSDTAYVHGSGPRDYAFAIGTALAAAGGLGHYDQIVFLNDDDTPQDGALSSAVWSDISFA